MEPYSFLRDDWDGNPKTVWSRKKQKKLFNIIKEKYPTPIDLKKKLLSLHNPEAIKLGKYIDPNWDQKQYYTFIISNVIKYSNAGKIILSQIIGAAIGTGAWLGTSKYLEKGLSSYDRTLADLKPKETLEIASSNPAIIKDIISAEAKANSAGYSNNKYIPFISGLGTKSLATYGAYKFLDKIDK